jgi:hypothetical protein
MRVPRPTSLLQRRPSRQPEAHKKARLFGGEVCSCLGGGTDESLRPEVWLRALTTVFGNANTPAMVRVSRTDYCCRSLPEVFQKAHLN